MQYAVLGGPSRQGVYVLVYTLGPALRIPGIKNVGRNLTP